MPKSKEGKKKFADFNKGTPHNKFEGISFTPNTKVNRDINKAAHKAFNKEFKTNLKKVGSKRDWGY